MSFLKESPRFHTGYGNSMFPLTTVVRGKHTVAALGIYRHSRPGTILYQNVCNNVLNGLKSEIFADFVVYLLNKITFLQIPKMAAFFLNNLTDYFFRNYSMLLLKFNKEFLNHTELETKQAYSITPRIGFPLKKHFYRLNIS